MAVDNEKVLARHRRYNHSAKGLARYAKYQRSEQGKNRRYFSQKKRRWNLRMAAGVSPCYPPGY